MTKRDSRSLRHYIGLWPGNIVQRSASAHAPRDVLDDVDKLGAGFHGDRVVRAA